MEDTTEPGQLSRNPADTISKGAKIETHSEVRQDDLPARRPLGPLDQLEREPKLNPGEMQRHSSFSVHRKRNLNAPE